jgi:hypothetical protein
VAARAAVTVGCLPHVLLEIEQSGNVVTALAQSVGSGHAVGSVNQIDFAVGPDD